MRPKPIVGALAGVLIVGGTAMLAAPAQTTQQPGQMTQARVWIQNRGRSEAVPVDLRETNLDVPLRVRIVGGDPAQLDPVIVRAVVPKWDYRSVTLPSDQAVVESLTREGAGGWETTGIVFPGAGGGTTFLLKRPR
jgi:hypothetical protein